MVSDFLLFLMFLNPVTHMVDGFQMHRDLWEVFLPRNKRRGSCKCKVLAKLVACTLMGIIMNGFSMNSNKKLKNEVSAAFLRSKSVPLPS